MQLLVVSGGVEAIRREGGIRGVEHDAEQGRNQTANGRGVGETASVGGANTSRSQLDVEEGGM